MSQAFPYCLPCDQSSASLNFVFSDESLSHGRGNLSTSSISELTFLSSVAESSENKGPKRKRTVKQDKKKDPPPKFVPWEAYDVINGHRMKGNSSKKCSCLKKHLDQHKGINTQFLEVMIDAVRSHIISNINGGYRSAEHIEYIRNLLPGKSQVTLP
jgi:hypothetical protein